MLLLLLIILLLFLSVYFFVHRPPFGKIPTGNSLQRIKNSPHYREGKFQNLNPTPDLTASYFKVMKEFFTNRSKRLSPKTPLPSQKNDLLALDPTDDMLVWFGHSSYFMQLDGRKFLVDPVFSGAASPIKSTTPSYPGTDRYTPQDFPDIDYLFITHDHWDHLDYETVKQLKPKIKKIITGLGTAAHLQRWGFDLQTVSECDWGDELKLEESFVVNATPARHFSGRGFKRNQVLWMSFVLRTPTQKIYIGGDSGYDTHFASIGQAHGPFDLAILECGQYNQNWRYIHMMPEELITASQELKAKKLLPVHWAKFALAQHAWDDSIIRVTAAAKQSGQEILHPMIGEKLNLKNPAAATEWWVGID